MVDFSTVSLRIMSPDGKTVLAELDKIDQSGQRVGKGFREHGANLNRAASAGRELGFIMSGVRGGAEGAASAAAHIAEQIALSTTNAKALGAAVGAAAVIGLGVQMFTIWKESTDAMKDFNAEVNKLGNATAIANMQGFGPGGDLKAKAEGIRTATQEELDGLHKRAKALKLNDDEEKELAKRIRERGKAQVDALMRQTRYAGNKDFLNASFGARDQHEIGAFQLGAGINNDRATRQYLGEQEARIKMGADIRALKLTAEEKHYTKEEFETRRKEIFDAFVQQTKLLELDLEKESQKVGATFTQSLAGSISDGISSAVQSGSISNGFKALTGGILIGLGDMMQTIGTESLVAATLFKSLVDALRSFDPEGAIARSLLLIAAGGVLKGLGTSMGGGRSSAGSGGRGGYGGYGGGYSGGSTSYIGVLNPSPAPNISGLAPAAPVTVHATIIGKDDPSAQRQILELIARAQRRGGTSG